MRRMFSLNQLIALIQQYAPEFDPSEAELGTLVSALGLDSNGDLKKQNLAGMFDGKYVKIMDAPESTTLTDEQINIMKEGVFIEGNFLGFTNPIILPMDNLLEGCLIARPAFTGGILFRLFAINDQKQINLRSNAVSMNKIDGVVISGTSIKYQDKVFPSYPSNTNIGQLICRKGVLEWYIPVAQDGITSGDTIALTSDLGKALIDHLEVEINGFRARYQYTEGNYVVYSSMAEADSGVNLQVNMISYNTTNGELSFNQMKFAPVV